MIADERPTVRRSWPHLPALDGVRAVAVLAVVAYHLELASGRATGGYLGVEVFFVVSGFLITGLLLEESRAKGSIGLRRFWIRRARRLLPAVVVLVGAVLAWSALTVPSELSTFRADGLAGLLYVQNWHAVFADIPYFAEIGRPSPFRHLWSLSIEEQFYVLWPLLVLVGARWLPRAALVTLTAAGIGASALLMGTMVEAGSLERAYHGTDTRAFGLLVGAALAMVWRPAAPDGPRPGRLTRSGVDVIAAAALLALVWQLDRRSEYDPWTFPRGLLLVDALTVALIVAAGTPGSWVAAGLGRRMLVALGRRSYSLYLWHWPVLVFTRPGTDIALEGWPATVVRLAMAAALAEASFRWIEMPVRDGRAQAWMRRTVSRWTGPRRGAAVAGAVAVVAPLVVVSVVARPPTDQESVAVPVPQPVVVDPTTTTPFVPPRPTLGGDRAPTTTTTEPAAPLVIGDPVTAVGDSVMLGAELGLRQRFADIDLDAEVGRQVDEVVEEISARAAAGSLRPTVVVHAGNNGTIPDGALDRLLDVVGERQLILLTVSVPRRWEGQVNDSLRSFAEIHDDVGLVDWSRVASDEVGLKGDDDVHLTGTGVARYADLVAREVAGISGG